MKQLVIVEIKNGWQVQTWRDDIEQPEIYAFLSWDSLINYLNEEVEPAPPKPPKRPLQGPGPTPQFKNTEQRPRAVMGEDVESYGYQMN